MCKTDRLEQLCLGEEWREMRPRGLGLSAPHLDTLLMPAWGSAVRVREGHSAEDLTGDAFL